MKKYLSQLLLVLFATACFNSCTKSDPVNNGGGGGTVGTPAKLHVDITSSIDPTIQLRLEGSCTQVYAFYQPRDQNGQPNRALTVQGTDGTKLLGMTFYWTGAFPSNPVFNFDPNFPGTNLFAAGLYFPNKNNTTTTYTSIGGSLSVGNCQFTYDPVTQTVGGAFQFLGKLNVNGTLTGPTATFAGYFSGVPINDLTDPNNPKGPCYNSTGAVLGSN
jgi:hypothetical protein